MLENFFRKIKAFLGKKRNYSLLGEASGEFEFNFVLLNILALTCLIAIFPSKYMFSFFTGLFRSFHYNEYYNNLPPNIYGPYIVDSIHLMNQLSTHSHLIVLILIILIIVITISPILLTDTCIGLNHDKSYYFFKRLSILLAISGTVAIWQQFPFHSRVAYSVDCLSLSSQTVSIFYDPSTHIHNSSFPNYQIVIIALVSFLTVIIAIINRIDKTLYAKYFMRTNASKAKNYIEDYIFNYERNKTKCLKIFHVFLIIPETQFLIFLHNYYLNTGQYENAKLISNKYNFSQTNQYIINSYCKKASSHLLYIYLFCVVVAIIIAYILLQNNYAYVELMYHSCNTNNNFGLNYSNINSIHTAINVYSSKLELKLSYIDSALFYIYVGSIGALSVLIAIKYKLNRILVRYNIDSSSTKIREKNVVNIIKLSHLLNQVYPIIIGLIFSILLTATFIYHSQYFIILLLSNIIMTIFAVGFIGTTRNFEIMDNRFLWVEICGTGVMVPSALIILFIKLKYTITSELYYINYRNINVVRNLTVTENILEVFLAISVFALIYNLFTYFELYKPYKAYFVVQELINTANSKHTQNKYKVSNLLYQRAEEAYGLLSQPLNLSILEILNLYEKLTYSFLKLNKFNDGKKYATIFFELASKYDFKESISRGYYFIGYIEEQNENYEEAFTNYENSIDIIELVRKGILESENRQKYFEDKAQAYEQMVLLCIKLGKIDTAFEYVERSKSRAFVDMLSNKELWSGDVDEKLLKAKKEIIEKIHELTRKLNKEQSTSSERSVELENSPILELGEELKSAELKHSEILAKIREQNPEYGSLFDTYMLPLNQIKDITKTNEVAILEYYITKDKVLAFFVINGTIICENLDVKPEKLNELYTRLRTKTNEYGDKRKFDEISKNIYDLIMKPIENNIPEYADLCIVPHGFLHVLPFNALFDGSNYLIEKYRIFYSPSSTVLNFCIEKDINPKDSCLSIGNPTHNLNYAEMEAKGVSDLFTTSLKLIGDDATKESVVSQCGNYNILHMACHGYFVNKYPLSSGLKLANGKDLYAGEIFELNLNQSSIVILSACQTALSKISTGDELVGMIRAFMFAGAPSVMATMWKVDDKMTGELVKDFCIGFRENKRVNALKDAQMKFINGEYGEKYKHPYYWAAFEMIGSY